MDTSGILLALDYGCDVEVSIASDFYVMIEIAFGWLFAMMTQSDNSFVLVYWSLGWKTK